MFVCKLPLRPHRPHRESELLREVVRGGEKAGRPGKGKGENELSFLLIVSILIVHFMWRFHREAVPST